jgi:large subunit ribosomal protein L4
MARLGDKKSPVIRGGGVAFGPKPRDFGTDLPTKIYDLAFRTALSYRYKKGELLVVDRLDIVGVHENSMERYVRDVLGWNRLEKSLFVSKQRRHGLFDALEVEGMQNRARAMDVEMVDVKDLLSGGRIVVERSALETLFKQHEEDLAPKDRLGAWRRTWTGGEVNHAAVGEARV